MSFHITGTLTGHENLAFGVLNCQLRAVSTPD
jgi:hypothetical protein